MVYISSCVTYMTMPTMATYSGTKTSNAVICKLQSKYCNKSKNWKSLVDFQSVHPATTTTALNNFETGSHASKPSETSYGSLSDLGDQKVVAGSTLHNVMIRIFPILNFKPI